MIVYFTDRQLNILGQASTGLPNGLTVTEDWKVDEIETGVAVFECTIPFEDETRALVEACTKSGNYILRSYDNANEFYTIVEREIDTKNQEVTIYAEDAGLDLLNEIVEAYEADKAYNIAYYIEKFAYDSGFEIGINEAASLTRKLSWDGESTAAERIASVATQFDGCEISFSFDIKGLEITHKYINIFKERGKDIGANLRLNEDIDKIVTKESIMNLATALKCTGGTPEDEDTEDDKEPVPITLKGYKYDDGNYYVDGVYLKSREALKKWSRYSWTKEPNQTRAGGHITRPFSYDTLSQSELCSRALTELKKACEMEVNYEVDISKLPDNIKVGDRINIIDDAGELYVSARLLKLEVSVANNEHKATLGEFLIKSSGISQKVAELAAQFAKTTQSVARALAIAKTAKAAAEAAKAQANSALEGAEETLEKAEAAQEAANAASGSASAAQEQAAEAQAKADAAMNSVSGIQQTIENAQAAAQQAQQAAQTAVTKADEAYTAAVNAQAKAEESHTAAQNAQAKAEEVFEKADEAKSTADLAKADAEAAIVTARAAKLDAQIAQKEIDSLGYELTTLETTMAVEYARKTDLTEAEALLQSQITQNATELASTVKKVQDIDETTNNAHKLLEGALAWAEKAQEQADRATEEAEAAQAIADEAREHADTAQAEANAAHAAAETAQTVADEAEAALAEAEADLETIRARADATEAEIAAAMEAVEAARQTAISAKAESIVAKETAAQAQAEADAAAQKAAAAQEVANTAAANAAIAQQLADEANGDATEAQQVADEAAQIANEAQRAANEAVETASTAQALADDAAYQAEAAEKTAANAQAQMEQANEDLTEAQQLLAEVMAKVDATEEEVAAAQAFVERAQAAASVANANAVNAQAAANTARANATNAQAAADAAQLAADEAQQAAAEAHLAAYQAQGEVYGLAHRVKSAETQIVQNSEQIALSAKKSEVAEMLGGYSTKEETEAALTVKANEISMQVSTRIEGLEIGARNLIRNSKNLIFEDYYFMRSTEPSSGVLGVGVLGSMVIGGE